jgi:hypothetical protein
MIPGCTECTLAWRFGIVLYVCADEFEHEHLRNIFHREYNKSIEKIRRETDPKLIQGKSVPARTLH